MTKVCAATGGQRLNLMVLLAIPLAAVVLNGSAKLRLSATEMAQPACDNSSKQAQEEEGWKSLFNNKDLQGWQATKFGGQGNVTINESVITLWTGSDLTGITYAGKPPRSNYEISLEGMRVDGSDFFCTTTFPVGGQSCSLVVGGWGGGVVGLSNINGQDASENNSSQYFHFKDKQWYQIRIRVTDSVIACWIDDKQVIDVQRDGNQFDIRPEVELNKPLGISTWQTTGAIRNIRLREISGQGM